MNKYEKLIEHIINDETEKARALFHTIVVEKSRDIYESLVDECDFDRVGGYKVNGLTDEVTSDEEGLTRDDDEGYADDSYGDTSAWGGGQDGEEDDSEFDFDGDGELDSHEESHEEEGDELHDLKATLDELSAKFDQLLAGKDGDSEFGDEDEFGGEQDEFGGEDDAFGGEQDEFGSEEGEGEDNFGGNRSFGGEDDTDDEELDEVLVREYVEKVGDFYKSSLDSAEGKEVGKGGSAPINKRSINAKPNRMGGDSLKFGQAGEKDTSGNTPPKGENNAYKKGQGELDLGKRNVNQPVRQGAHKFYNTKRISYEKAKGKEGQTTDGKLSVDTKSVGGKIKR